MSASRKLTRKKLELLQAAGYSGKIMELYSNQVNVGSIENPDVTLAYTGSCGDTIKLYLTINNDNVITDAKFQYLGCPASAACGSVMTRIVIDKTLQEAKEITENDVLKELGGLPDDECHCAKLAVKTLHKAIRKYEGNKKPF